MELKTLLSALNLFVFVIGESSYIELYQEANFGGDKYVLHESDDNLSGVFNDRASSFRVRNLSHQQIREHVNQL